MIESPVLQDLKAEWTREAALEAALQPGAEEIATELESITDEARLKEWIKLAAVCSDLPSYRKELAA